MPSNQNLKRKQRGRGPARKGGRGAEVATVRRDSEGERKRSKLSTRIGREAWQQAEQKRKSEGAARRTDSTEGTADRGRREEGKRKNGRLSSQNRAKADERKQSEGKARKRKQKGSIGGTAVGAKPRGMKGNKQRAEYEEPGEKTRETRSERTGKAKETKVERAHRGNHCEMETGRKRKGRNRG